jgi:hypothetical protein
LFRTGAEWLGREGDRTQLRVAPYRACERRPPRRAGHDFCAICAALSLTSNSVLPAVSLLTTPVDHPHEWAADFRTAQVSFGLHFHFQARAPPHTI